jgi:hypothetical protein
MAFLSLKNCVNVPSFEKNLLRYGNKQKNYYYLSSLTKIPESGVVSQRYGSADPIP